MRSSDPNEALETNRRPALRSGQPRPTLVVGPLRSGALGGKVRHMIQTVEAVIDDQGRVRLLEPVNIDRTRRALVTILEEEPAPGLQDVTLLSESALAEDWDRPEEEAAWSHLQKGQ